MNMTREELDRLYNQEKLSLREIAHRLGASERTLCRRMDQWGLSRRTLAEAGQLQLDDAEIERLYTVERLTMGEIAQRVNVSVPTIRQRLDERGVARRGLSEAAMRYPRRNFSGDLIEKAYLIGLRLGDLHVRMSNDGPNCASITVGCSSTRVEQINLLHELFGPYGHVNVTPPRKNGSHTVQCQLNLSFDFLLPLVST